ncbi:hypothetical protein [Ethanoligenens sp.]|uniref:hypothetical protein n=1 Tax=Ethanoligenens sp. TaxID=2099655 RepID=UPI0039E76CCF
MNTIQTITRLEALIASLAGCSAEDYHEIEDATIRGLECARVALVMKGDTAK